MMASESTPKEYEYYDNLVTKKCGLVSELSIAQVAELRQKKERTIRDWYAGNIHGGYIGRLIVVKSMREADMTAAEKTRQRARANKQKSPVAG